MAFQVELKSKEQFLGDLVRTIIANSDLSDVAEGSSLASTLEGIAANDFQIAVSALKILENSNLESLVGAALDKKAEAVRLPNGIGGFGRFPSSQAGGQVLIGSGFAKVSSKLYAGKPAPFPGTMRLFLEDASSFTPTGSVYLGRGTIDRFEGPVAYTSVVNNGSFWTIELATPITKGHLYSDLVVLAQGGNRTVGAGTIVQVPGTAGQQAVNFAINSSVVIPDGEAETTALVTCVQFGEVGNVLSGAIKAFTSTPFGGATVTNLTSYSNGRSTESDEDLRKRLKNYPSTLSRGTKTAILAAIQGIDDPDTGQTLTSAVGVEPTEPGDSSKIYIDNGVGLEPTFDAQPYQLLLQSASGQETSFRAAKFPITPATIIGAESGPFVITADMSLTVIADGVAETYTISPSNYSNLNAATGYEAVRDFNSQSNIVGFRTLNGGKSLALIDLSGTVEELFVQPGELQRTFGFPLATVRPIFVYRNNELQSFRGATATLSTSAFPWGLVAADLENVRVVVDGVTQTITIADTDFSAFNSTIASATLNQWATVLRTKIAGVKFTVSGSVLVWSSWQDFSPTGTLQILETRADGSAAGWIAESKMWKPVSSGGVLADAGDTRDFSFNRFTGELTFLEKPAPGSTIEIGSRTTRAQIRSTTAPSGLFTLNTLPSTVGSAKLVLGFDGEFAIRNVVTNVGVTVTPSIPDSSGASNVVRLTSNDAALWRTSEVGDYLYLVKDASAVPSWGADVQGIYRLKAVGMSGYATNQVFMSLTANTLSGSAEVTITQANHGFRSGARISVTTAVGIGGISAGNLSQALVTITVLSSSQYKYTAGAAASSTATGTLDTVTYDADAWAEFEVSQPQLAAWTPLLAVPQSILLGMVNVFLSTVIPQIVDFGAVGAVTIDGVVSAINSQIASGSAVKVNPQSLTVRSNDFALGTCAVLATVGNAGNVFGTGVASSIQSHIAYSDSGYAKSGFASVRQVMSPTTAGKSYRFWLDVGPQFTDITTTAANPAIESPSFEATYPVGFEHAWVTGRQAGLLARVYNNQTVSPYAGLMRGEGAIRPLQTSDTEQTSPDTLNRYANYGLRFVDLALTPHDRLVVEMDLDPIDKTVAVPMHKRAQIQDMDALTGVGRGQVISFRLKDPEDPDPNNSDLPRPFFDSQSVYRTYDFRDFRLLTRSVGLYRDFSTYNVYATGSLTAIPSGLPSGISDGDTFTLDDGVNPPSVFEFNGTGGVTPGNIAIAFTPGVFATGTLTAIAAHAMTGIVDGDKFTLNDGVHPAVIFEFDSGGGVTLGNVTVPFIAAVAATGSLTATNADPSTGIKVGDTFVLSDGVNPAKTFEFETGGGVGVGHVSVLLPSATATPLQVKTAMISAINGAASLNITASSGLGNQIGLVNDTPGAAGNVAITESLANAITLFPTGMSGGVNNDTAATIRTAMISAINGAAALDITAAPGGGTLINLTNDTTGAMGNVAITQVLANGTLTPVGMSGGVNETTAAAMKAAMLAAINGAASLDIVAVSGTSNLLLLTNEVAGPGGNIAIVESVALGTLSPTGMSGGAAATTNSRALVLRSVEMGSPTRLRLSIRYSVIPDIADIVISHINSFKGDASKMTILATLPADVVIAGSLYNTGNYTVFVTQEGSLYRLTFVGAGLNPGGEYVVGQILNVASTSVLGGSYHIVAAAVGSVSVLAPGTAGVANGTLFSALQFPLRSYAALVVTWEDLADAINAYLPDTPIATAEAIGTGFAGNPIKEPTYIAYPQPTVYAGTDMSGAFDHHSFAAHLAGVAGVFAYDSSVPSLNGIQATVQSEDSIFPTTTEAAGTTYTPIDEEAELVPANSKSLRSWLSFNAASSLPIVAEATEIRGSTRVQLNSRQDGSPGAVRITGVTANRIESFVIGNGTVDNEAARVALLSTDAQSLVRGGLVRMDNSVTTELFRPYRLAPTGAAETPYNTANINTYFRPTNSLKYIKLTANTARIVFYRFGTFPGQSEPLATSDQITLTNLGNGYVQFVSAGGDLAARVGDMMYIKPGSAFAADAECKALPGVTGITAGAAPEYLGYPVVEVIDDKTVIVVAPNITTFGMVALTSTTDLVFLPSPYNEKNIRTNKQEGAKFNTEINSGNMYILVKPLGGNMVSVFVQNSSTEATDSMRLGDLLVNTDDWVTLGEGFDLANRGTFRLVAHDGRNHMILYNPVGGKEETLDVSTLTGGGRGQRKWRIGPIKNVNVRPVRIVDGESVRLQDRLRISTPQTTSQWFPDTMIGSFRVIGMGWIGVSQATGSLTAIAANPSTGIADGDTFVISDGLTTKTFEFDTNASWNSANVRVPITTNESAAGVKAAIITAINGLGSALLITAGSGLGMLVSLLNRRLDATISNVAITQLLANAVTLTPVGMSGAAVADGQIEPYIDIELPGAPLEVYDTAGVPVNKWLVAGNDSAIGFVEAEPYFGFRVVGGVGLNPQITERSDVHLLPRNVVGKFAETFGTKVTALFKTGFEERTFQGIDGYKVFAGLVREAHRVIDGLPSNPILFPGVKAMGTVVEVLPPLIRSLQIDLQVRPKDGVTLNSISDVVRSTVASYVNRLGVGKPVVIAEIVRIVQSLPGVFSVTVLNTRPAAIDDRIVVSDIEKPFILDASKDITIG